jgi:4-diphosphocytidyl-2-C-methyl-D-erythritol kinase
MEGIRVEAHAKVNLGLAVLGKRADGYHEIDTVFQTVSLSDSLTIRPSPGRRSQAITLAATGLPVPVDEANLAFRAASVLVERTRCPGVSISLEKRIPVGAGLGGGSADAAAVLVGMNSLFDLGLKTRELEEAGLALGSDVPFLVRGGAARGRGRGERLERIAPLVGAWLILAAPSFEVSAREAYGLVRIGLTAGASFIKLICSAMQKGDVRELAALLRNDLEPGVSGVRPEVAAIKNALIAGGALGAVMSGSGPTVVGVTTEQADADRIGGLLAGRGLAIHVVEPVGHGCRIAGRKEEPFLR